MDIKQSSLIMRGALNNLYTSGGSFQHFGLGDLLVDMANSTAGDLSGLTGDVTSSGTGIATTVVNTVGGKTASAIAAAVNNSHSPLTIGTANGLSLIGQALSLQTASGSLTGALSSANWTTFNNKVSGPNSSVLNTISRWAGIDGKVLTGSGIQIDDNDRLIVPGQLQQFNQNGALSDFQINGVPGKTANYIEVLDDQGSLVFGVGADQSVVASARLLVTSITTSTDPVNAGSPNMAIFTISVADQPSGSISITSGDASGTGIANNVSLNAGNGTGPTAEGGSVALTAGGSENSSGGSVILSGPTENTGNNHDHIQLLAGANNGGVGGGILAQTADQTTGNLDSGSVTIQIGAASGTGTRGAFNVDASQTNLTGGLSINSHLGIDHTETINGKVFTWTNGILTSVV